MMSRLRRSGGGRSECLRGADSLTFLLSRSFAPRLLLLLSTSQRRLLQQPEALDAIMRNMIVRLQALKAKKKNKNHFFFPFTGTMEERRGWREGVGSGVRPYGRLR